MFKLVNQQDEKFYSLWDLLVKSDLQSHCLYTSRSFQYYREYFKDRDFKVHGIILTNGAVPIAGVCFTSDKRGHVTNATCFGRGIRYFISASLSTTQKSVAEGQISEFLSETIASFQTKLETEIIVRHHLLPLHEELLRKSAELVTRYSQVLNLTPEVETIKAGVRKSYKSLINWGEKNIQWTVKATAADRSLVEMQSLHLQVAGKSTRSDKTWRIQEDMIAAGEAFAIYGYIDGKLETSCIVNYHGPHGYYSVSASNRELFDKPLLHNAIWKSIMKCKELGVKHFELGDQFLTVNPESGKSPTEKEVNISTFKRGFGGETVSIQSVSKKGENGN